jgi:hypothetical protein
VLHGETYYGKLLGKSSWISNYFPHRYNQRISSTNHRPVNLLLFLLIGTYIKTKSAVLNWKFRKQGRLSSLFNVKIGPDHCIFESDRYATLRTLYRQLDKKARPELVISN